MGIIIEKGNTKEARQELIAYIMAFPALEMKSGYYYVFRYIDDAYYKSCLATDGADAYYEFVKEHPIDPQVYTDVIHAQDMAYELYLQDEHPLQDYSDEAEEISEVGWDTQAEILQDYSYDYVVGLLLWYYDGKLF